MRSPKHVRTLRTAYEETYGLNGNGAGLNGAGQQGEEKSKVKDPRCKTGTWGARQGIGLLADWETGFVSMSQSVRPTSSYLSVILPSSRLPLLV